MSLSFDDLPRRLGRLGESGDGPALLCVGGLHGNEPAGVHGLVRVVEKLERDPRGLRGLFLALVGNRPALDEQVRFVDEDLNRVWTPERIDAAAGESVEALERRELLAEIDELRREVSGPLFGLDLHSTSSDGGPFTVFDDTLAIREFAFALPGPHVLGLEEELAGTMVGYLNGTGFVAIGFESGQHDDPGAVDTAEAAIWVALEASGVLERGVRAEVRDARAHLERERQGLPRVVEVRYRHELEDATAFRMLPGFGNFHRVREGEKLADSDAGEVRAPDDGLVLMPLYQAQGGEGFFLVRPVRFFWLAFSKYLRRLRFDRFLHWLPGVRRDPAAEDELLVDRSRARWLALEAFHLLGFKRLGPRGATLRMVRRDRGRRG